MGFWEDATPSGQARQGLWAIVLANAADPVEDEVAPAQAPYPAPRPRPYWRASSGLTHIEQTCFRAFSMAAPGQTVTVIGPGHGEYVENNAIGIPGRLLELPADGGTLSDILIPMAWILGRDPEAVVTVLPWDHYVDPAEDFRALLNRVSAFADCHPNEIFALGAEASEAITDYGWIEPGAAISPNNRSVRRVAKFHRASDAAQAVAFYRAGYLWNTSIFVARAAAFWENARVCVPEAMERFDALRVAIAGNGASPGTSIWEDLVADTLNGLNPLNFENDVLRPLRAQTAVVPMIGLFWADLVRPERMLEILEPIDDSHGGAIYEPPEDTTDMR